MKPLDMKSDGNGADFPGNGTHRTTNAHRTTEKARPAQPVPQAIDATFAAAEFAPAAAEPIDAPMWPLHAALWLQLEMAPSIPVWTGLAIERHNRIPAPGFLYFDTAPPDRPGILDSSAFPSGKTAPGTPARLDLPESGLTPLGWDPRAVCRKQGGI
jgi:hypothetical protein